MEMSTTISTASGVVMSRSSGDNEPAHYMFKVEGFSLLSEAGIDKFESNTFESGDYKWKLVLYPNGNTVDEGDKHISLYLRIVETKSLPKGWEVYVYFKFYVYDHIQENYITIQDAHGRKRRFHSAKLEWGFGKMFPLKIFKDTSNGYLFHDTCLFGVEVFVTPKFVVKENCLSMVKLPATNKSYSWTIENFPSLVEVISSEHFKVGKIKWKLDFYPRGNKTGSGSHLSLYLSIADHKSLPIDWRIYAKFNLRLKAQSGTDDHIEQKASHWFCDEENNWGIDRLRSLKDRAKSYLVGDKLILEVEFDALGVI